MPQGLVDKGAEIREYTLNDLAALLPDGIKGLLLVATIGARKHGWGPSWKATEEDRQKYLEKSDRHKRRYKAGERIDEDGFPTILACVINDMIVHAIDVAIKKKARE